MRLLSGPVKVPNKPFSPPGTQIHAGGTPSGEQRAGPCILGLLARRVPILRVTRMGASIQVFGVFGVSERPATLRTQTSQARGRSQQRKNFLELDKSQRLCRAHPTAPMTAKSFALWDLHRETQRTSEPLAGTGKDPRTSASTTQNRPSKRPSTRRKRGTCSPLVNIRYIIGLCEIAQENRGFRRVGKAKAGRRKCCK